mmetsp:Transcript_50963/g.94349  ORF Transcript_50963/g.94349 Transcript_50963/m.94349 type:complete len:170 (-) Transcript_50963:64-573(-)
MSLLDAELTYMGLPSQHRARDPDLQSLHAFREEMLPVLDSDEESLANSEGNESAPMQTFNDRSGEELGCDDCGYDTLPSAVRVQLQLCAIKQQLKRMTSINDFQEATICEVTGEHVAGRGPRGASNALVRMFGCFDANDRRPETLKQLQELEHKLHQVGCALTLRAGSS